MTIVRSLSYMEKEAPTVCFNPGLPEHFIVNSTKAFEQSQYIDNPTDN